MAIELNTLNPLKLQDLNEGTDINEEEELDEEDFEEEFDGDLDEEEENYLE